MSDRSFGSNHSEGPREDDGSPHRIPVRHEAIQLEANPHQEIPNQENHHQGNLPEEQAAAGRLFPASLADIDACQNLFEIRSLFQEEEGVHIQICFDMLVRCRQRRLRIDDVERNELNYAVNVFRAHQHRVIISPSHCCFVLPTLCHMKIMVEQKTDDNEKRRMLVLDSIHQAISQFLDNYIFENARDRKNVHLSLCRAIQRDYNLLFPFEETENFRQNLLLEYHYVLHHYRVPNLCLENERLGLGLAEVADTFILERRVRMLYEDFVLREIHLHLMTDAMHNMGIDSEPTRHDVLNYFRITSTVRDHFHAAFLDILEYGNPIRRDRLQRFNNGLRRMVHLLTPVRQRGLQRIRIHEMQEGPMPDGFVRMLQQPPPQNLFDENDENANPQI